MSCFPASNELVFRLTLCACSSCHGRPPRLMVCGLSVCLPVCSFVRLRVSQSVCPLPSPVFCFSVSLAVSFCLFPFFRLCVCVCGSLGLSICLYVSVRRSVYAFVCLFIFSS